MSGTFPALTIFHMSQTFAIKKTTNHASTESADQKEQLHDKFYSEPLSNQSPRLLSHKKHQDITGYRPQSYLRIRTPARSFTQAAHHGNQDRESAYG